MRSEIEQNNRCILDLERCFGPFWTRRENVTSADMFKRLTFHHPECGDCRQFIPLIHRSGHESLIESLTILNTVVIMALVTASGPLGLSAFFPEKDNVYINGPLAVGRKFPRYLPPPHLPLTSTWQEADFSLENVMASTALPGEQVNLREYCMKLLSRYLYLSGRFFLSTLACLSIRSDG